MTLLTAARPLAARVAGSLTLLGLLLEAALLPANPPPFYNPPAVPPERAGPPVTPPPVTAPPALRSYPPSWYWDPYTQGVTALPQRGGD